MEDAHNECFSKSLYRFIELQGMGFDYMCVTHYWVDNKKALELENKAYFLTKSSIFKDFQHWVLDSLKKLPKNRTKLVKKCPKIFG